MTTISAFEDIEAWKKARQLVSDIYKHTKKPEVKTDFGYCDQIQRAAMSAMSNIAEGFGRQSDKEFAQFLNLSKGSACEVSSMLYAGLDIGYLSTDEFGNLQTICKDTLLMTAKLQGYLRRSIRSSKSVRHP